MKFNKIFTAIIFLICTVFIWTIFKTSNIYPVVNSIDNDAAAAVATTLKTSWSTSNGNFSYGPVYYRVARSVADSLSFVVSYPPSQIIHVSLVLVTFLSFLGICYYLSKLLATDRLERKILFVGFLFILLINKTWIKYIFTAHPDVLMAFFIVASLYFLFSYIKLNKLRDLYVASVLFGFAIATKSPAFIFAPVLVTLFLIYKGVSLASAIKLVQLGVITVSSYFIIGWPQSSDISSTIEFYKMANLRIASAVNFESVLDWFKIFFDQLWLPAVILGFWFRLCFDKTHFNRKKLFTGLIFLLPFLVYLTQNIITTHDHYMIPVTAAIICSWAFILSFEKSNFAKIFESQKKIATVVLVVIVLAAAFSTRLYTYSSDYKEKQNRNAIVYDIALGYLKQNKTVYFGPYTPFPAGIDEPNVNFQRVLARWDGTEERINGAGVEVIVINKKVVESFIEQWNEPYFLQITGSLETGKKNRDFFDKFRNSKNGDKSWAAVYEDDFNIIWKRN